MNASSQPSDGCTHQMPPLADLDGAEIYSHGWTSGGRTYTVWWQLPNGALALSTFTPGELGQDTQARIMLE